MTIERRLNRLEEAAPSTRHPEELFIRHVIMEPDGTSAREAHVRRFVDGILVEQWVERTDDPHARPA